MSLAITGGADSHHLPNLVYSRRIAEVTTKGAEINVVSFPVTRDRLDGYREAAEAAGFAWDGVLIAVCAHTDVTEAEQIAAALLTSATPPDAIAAMSDQQAAGVVRAARAVGRLIPDDLALTGWDDATVAAQLELTTVAQSLRDQGGACAHAALGQKPNSYAMSWSIVRRASTRR